jgi:hypothetical protein
MQPYPPCAALLLVLKFIRTKRRCLSTGLRAPSSVVLPMLPFVGAPVPPSYPLHHPPRPRVRVHATVVVRVQRRRCHPRARALHRPKFKTLCFEPNLF